MPRAFKTSIHGRRLALSSSGYLTGDDNQTKGIDFLHGVVNRIQEATSDTTGTDIVAYGLTSVDSTTDDTWLLDPPIIGVKKILYFGSTSTGIRTIKRQDSSFAIRTSAASTLTTIVTQAGGHTLELIGVTSAIYGIVSKIASTEIAFNGTT